MHYRPKGKYDGKIFAGKEEEGKCFSHKEKKKKRPNREGSYLCSRRLWKTSHSPNLQAVSSHNGCKTDTKHATLSIEFDNIREN